MKCNPDEMSIELSKSKLLLLILGSIIFIALGVWLITLNQAAFESRIPLIIIQSFGLIDIIFFGLCGIVGVKKLFDREPGVQFTKLGVVDNSSGVAVGLIPWTDIVGTDIYTLNRQRMLVILLKNPEKYIEIGGPMKRWANQANFNMCGSPIMISSNALKINFDELVAVFDSNQSKYGLKG